MVTAPLPPRSALTLDELGRAALSQHTSIKSIEDTTSKPSIHYATDNARIEEFDSLKEHLERDTMVDLVNTKDEAEASEFDSEDEEEPTANVPKISEKRRADNVKFSAW